LANKNARIAWALLSKKMDYLPEANLLEFEGLPSHSSRLRKWNLFTHDYEAVTADGKQVEPAFVNLISSLCLRARYPDKEQRIAHYGQSLGSIQKLDSRVQSSPILT
jgi:hypothetical protein